MLIVVSSPTPVSRESAIINELFESGLAIFHLRKPESPMEMIHDLLKKIDPKYYDRIALHQHHILAEEFGIRRLHYTEAERMKSIMMYHPRSIYSTSVHSLDKYYDLPSIYSYTFLGPVFNSISKKYYKQMDDVNYPINLKNRSVKIIGIGGITKSNGLKALEYGFDGLALLGFLWQSEEPVVHFKSIQKLWNTTDQL